MNYEDLKNGDIITLINEYDEIRIVIVNKVKESLTGKTMLYILADLNTEDELFLEKYDPDFSYCLNDCVIRSAEEEEKIKLYDALYKDFTENFDIKWQRHFKDSLYFDIEDYLLDVFCINYKGDDNDLIIYPDFIYEIQKYIWDKCCEAMGYQHQEKIEKIIDMKDKQQEILNKVEDYLRETYISAIGEKDYSIDNMIEHFRNYFNIK